MTPNCLLTSREGRLLRLSLNRPEVRNALSRELCMSLVAEIGKAEGDRSVGAILLGGEGTVFCGGMDLKENRGDNLGELHAELFSLGTRLTKPMVAAVRGAAIAGGLGLALNAHIAIAASDARFGLTETRIGLWPYAVYPVVVAAVGPRRARELAISARIIDAETALRLGLVEHVVRPEELETKALELASTLAEGSAEAVANGLQYVRAIEGLGTVEALQQAVRSRVAVEASADFAEGVQAFREKRAPQWPSHR